jgi:hypothetical protein
MNTGVVDAFKPAKADLFLKSEIHRWDRQRKKQLDVNNAEHVERIRSILQSEM